MAESTTDDKWTIDKLDSSNWCTWKFQMKHMLLAKGLWGHVTGTERLADEATPAQQTELEKKGQRAFSTIVMAVSTPQLYLITSCEQAKEAWDALRDHFEKDTLANKLMLKKRYFRMEMAEGTPVESHLKQMKELTDKLAAIGAPVAEEDQVVTLLGSLPQSYSSLVTALESRENVSLSYVQQSLVHEEKKFSGDFRKQTTGSSAANEGTSALVGGYRGWTRGRRPVCFECQEEGHFRRDCPKLASASKHKAKSAELSSSESDSEKVGAFTASQVSTNKERWLIDSGASSHMCYSKDILIDYKEFSQPETVSLGDGRTVEAIGVGNVSLSMQFKVSDPKRCVMYKVLYVPKLACNLFSVRAAASKGNSMKFNRSKCWIRDRGGHLVGMGQLEGKLYRLNCETITPEHVSVAGQQEKESADLWHQRLGHVNGQQLEEIVSSGVVKGVHFSDSSLSFCEKCVEGKMQRKQYKPVGEIYSTRKLERIHSDVCGPMPTESIGGQKYFVTFIDDYSRCCKVYFMRHKSEVLSKFKEFESLVTNECGQNIGILRSDNVGEYTSGEFKAYLKSRGIRQELTVPKSPQQNGIAERMNQTLMEAARCMLSQAGVPNSYWAEAVATAAYLRNRTPTRAFKIKTTPFERWYGKRPNLSHLRVFGCTAYAHIPNCQRHKLDKKAVKLHFVGYCSESNGYRLLDEATCRVVIRRDVVFNETEFIDQTTSQTNKSVRVDIESGNQQATESTTEDPTPDSPHEYPRRERAPPVRYGVDEYVSKAAAEDCVSEPASIEEALSSPSNSEGWKAAADAEYQSLLENKTWDLVELPSNRKTIGCKWVFKAKRGKDGKVERLKARLVAKGYTQKLNVDYDETFAPVVRFSSIRALLALSVHNGMLVHQMDVVSAFLNGTLEEEVYMDQPSHYVQEGKENMVCKLNKSLYGLKQSPRCWNMVFTSYMEEAGFIQSSADPCVFVQAEEKDLTIIAVYVDDLIIVTTSSEKMSAVKKGLETRFKMKDLGKLHYCLGISIDYDEEKGQMWLHQKHYILDLLDKYGLTEAKTALTPADVNVTLRKDDGSSKAVDPTHYQSLIGSLLYCAIATRPDIAQAVGTVSKFCSAPCEAHLTAAKRILRYLKGTVSLALKYQKSCSGKLTGYSDADWGGDQDDRHSTSGNLFILSRGPISWLSKKQSVTALSTSEAEYVALSVATQEAVWLRRLLSEMRMCSKEPTVLKEDNQGAVAIAKNPVFHSRTKHIDIRYHYVLYVCMYVLPNGRSVGRYSHQASAQTSF